MVEPLKNPISYILIWKNIHTFINKILEFWLSKKYYSKLCI